MIDSENYQNLAFISSEMPSLLKIINKCFQCGSCAGVCPLRKVSKYNPRKIIHNALLGIPLETDDFTQCLTCGLCYEVCPQGINIPEFIRLLRTKSLINEDEFAHHNIFNLLQLFMAEMTESGIKTNYNGEIDTNSTVAYFSGCIDLFDKFLDLKKTNFHQIGQSAVNVMNKVGIKPNLLPLKCCGHDAFWTGDLESFDKVRQYNTQVIKASKISTLIVSCAECYYTFSELYSLNKVEIKHISHFIEDNQEKLKYNGQNNNPVTFHDPCRLGRYMKEYNSPRNVIKNSGTIFKELVHNKKYSNCCGVSAWLKCDDRSRSIMLNKLEEATKVVGSSGTLVVGCNKCFAHLNCVLEDRKPQHNYSIKIKELGTFIDEITVNKSNKEV